MIRNYLKVALRNLSRRTGYAFINVLGLAGGLACCLLIGVVEDFHHESLHRAIGYFVAAGSVILAVALLTVSYQTFRAACLDPVNALRTE